MPSPGDNRAALIGVLAAAACALGIIEHLVALPMPGVRLGLANLPILVGAYIISPGAVLLVALMKALLVPLLTGNLVIKLAIGLPATMASTLVMVAVARYASAFLSPLGAGAAGGFTHMAVQLGVVGAVFVKTAAIVAIAPWFLAIATLTGVLTGFISLMLLRAYARVHHTTP